MHHNTKSLIGLRFGKLIVKSMSQNRSSNNRIIWICQCDCGNEIERSSAYLNNKTPGVRSCGCEVGKNKIISVPIGTKKGKLSVIGELSQKISPNGDKHTMIKCQCNCGNIVEVNCAGFRKNKYLSCGRKVCKRQKTDKEMILNKVYAVYKTKAIERKYSFNLTKDFFSNLIFKNCYYCNSEPINIFRNVSNGPNGDKNTYYYNGVDRVDNNIGYETYNVVTCCKICNMMKMTLNKDDFLEHLRKIINHVDNKGKL